MNGATFLASTHDLVHLSPLRIDNGTGLAGEQLGSLSRGGPFIFDPFSAYQARLVTGPNVVVFGRIGSGKSALVKMILRRAVARGSSVVVLDPKGEYSTLAKQCNGSIFSVGHGTWFNLASGHDADDARVLCSLLSSARGSALSDLEVMQVENYWQESNAGRSERPIKTLLEWCQRRGDQELESTLRRFVVGDLRGLIDGPDIPSALRASITVLNLEQWWGTEVLGTVAMLAWIIAERALALASGNAYLVADEAWSLLDNRTSLIRLRGSLKLARSSGIAHVLVLHRLADLEAIGSVGTQGYAAAMSLLRDCDTHFLFQASSGDVDALGDELKLTPLERQYVAALPRGVALVRYGTSSSVVRIEPTVEDQIDTDAAMR